MRGPIRKTLGRVVLATVAIGLMSAGSALGAGVTGTPDRPPDTTNGWWNDNVGITWTADAPYSDPTPPATLVTAEGTVTSTATACDNTDPLNPVCDGTGSFTTKIDKTPPTIGITRTAANAFGWNKGTVTVGFNCADAFSGVLSCVGGGTFTDETAGTTVTGTATDFTNRTATASTVVKIDKTAPTIAGAGQTPGKNGNGWNNTNVTAIFTCTDPGTFASGVDTSAFDPGDIPTLDPDAVASGIDGSCPAPTVTTEGANQQVSRNVSDKAGNTSANATVTGINIDKTDPAITITRPTGTYDRLQAVTSVYDCSDALSGVAPGKGPGTACAGPIGSGAALDTSAGGTNQTFTVNAVDKAGNTAAKSVTYAIRPAAPQLLTPADSVTTNQVRPVFSWNNSAGSQVSKYEVYVKNVKIGTVNNPTGATSSFTPTSDLGPPFASFNTSLDWFVRAYGKDTNQSQKDSLHRTLKIDPTVPNAPSITGGPVGVTNVRTPTFTWAGAGPNFFWKVRRVSDDVVVQQGPTGGLGATVGPLADGSYAFEVQQAGANGVFGDAAVLGFTVDASAPGPPVITGGPGASTDVRTPAFSWVGEPGGSFVWTVLGGGTAVRSGATAALGATVTPALDPGPWVFVVQQVDAAGNISAPSAGYAFTVNPPPAPSILPSPVLAATAPATVTAKKTKKATSVLTPRTLNAKLLLPRAGAKLKTLTPVLRWKKRPKGVKIYNLQIFLNSKKILSRFPTGQSFKVPKGVLKSGKQYIWRVWPYFGKYPKSPLGLSYFNTVAVKKPVAKTGKATAKAPKK